MIFEDGGGELAREVGMEADTIDALSLITSLVGEVERGTRAARGGMFAKDCSAWASWGTSPLGVETSLSVFGSPRELRDAEFPEFEAGVPGLATVADVVTGVAAAEEEADVDVPVEALSTGVKSAGCFVGTVFVAAAMLSTPAAARFSARFSCLEGVAARSGFDGVATRSGFEGVATRSGFDGVDTRSGFGVETRSGFDGVDTRSGFGVPIRSGLEGVDNSARANSARPFLGVAAIDLGVGTGAGADTGAGLLTALPLRVSSAGKSSSCKTPFPLLWIAWDAMSFDKPLSAAMARTFFFASPCGMALFKASCVGPIGIVWSPWPEVAGRCAPGATDVEVPGKPGWGLKNGDMAMALPCGNPKPGGAPGVPRPGAGSIV